MNDSLSTIEIGEYENIIGKYREEILDWMQKEHTYKDLVEEVKPAWWNHFYIGAVASAVFISVTFFLLNK